ncbi:MAG: WYL domain-containing protein [Deltaproteobacteria bacterium]|nr:WYL domain-containing protein [Deltaproteobacteria bacterium]
MARAPSAETRLLRLAAWFAAQGEPVTREQIYEAFPDDYVGSDAAREKKFTRDKGDLESLGVPVRHVAELGEAGAYVVDTGAAFLPRLEFPPQEAAAVWLAGQSALRNHDHPLRDELELALRKLVVGTGGLPPRAATLETDGVSPEPAALRRHLARLAEALERRHTLLLRYARPGEEPTERRLDLHGYAWRRGEWIFAGHCHLRQAPRVFFLRRVRSLKLVPRDPRKPDYRIPASFDIRTWSRQQPWDYLAHGPREAAVRFRGSLAAVAARLLPGAKLTTEPDGSRTARLTVRNLPGLVRQALAWGPEAELIEPAEGRALARQILAGLRSRLEAAR